MSEEVTKKVFAVIRASGKQYRVTQGSKVLLDMLESKAGETVTFSDVLLAGTEGAADVKVATASGSPIGVTVTGRVLGQIKEKKVIIFKKRRRGGYTKKQGHRQEKTEILIDSISL